MSVPVRLAKGALAQAFRADQWWQKNRAEAPMLFVEELSRAMELLKVTPDIGTPYLDSKRKGIRRLLLQKTRYHLYYRHDTKKPEVVVVAVWSSVRGRGPSL